MEDLLSGKLHYKPLELARDTPIEKYHLSGNGNGDRFASRNLGEVLLSASGRHLVFYSVGPDSRWLRNEGGTAGDVQRRARDIVEEMRARSRAMADEALAASDENEAEKKAKWAESLSKWAHASDSLRALDDMVRTGCLTHGMVCTPDTTFDMNEDLLATPGKMLHFTKDGVLLREIRKDDMVTFSTSVEYRPELLEEANTPELMRQYFDTFMPESTRQKMVFKALGTALLGGNKHRLLVIFKGKSTTGKTQLVEAIREALGDYAGSGTPSIFRGNLDDKARPDVLRLLKKRFAFLPEASKSWELHGDRVKALTGGDAVPVRRMRSDDFLEVVPQFTPVIYANEMPRVNGADLALKRRMLVIDFERSPETEDPRVKQAFLESVQVREYLFAALVKGYLDSLAEGIKDVQDRFASLTGDAFEATTHMGEFFTWLEDSGQLHDAGDGAKSSFVTMKAFHLRYAYWVKEHGNVQDKKDGLNYREFNEQLRSVYGWKDVNSAGRRWVGKVLNEMVPLN